jgi:2-aminoadipate transaminase
MTGYGAVPASVGEPAEMWRFGTRGKGLRDSVIRALTKQLAGRTGLVSFAGGMPSPLTFPDAAVASAFEAVMRQDSKAALQYGPSDGYPPLRQWIAESLSSASVSIGADQVIVTSGSQQGLDLLGKVMLDATDTVAVETPTYLGALQSLGLYATGFLSAPTDGLGIVPAAFDALLSRASGAGRQCKLLYAIPTFQNPTGRTMPLSRRTELVTLCARRRIPIVEDNPYGELDHEGRRHVPLLELGEGNVAYLGSFSKVLSPGLRIGYVVAPRPLARKLELAKQASDLHTCSLTQRLVFEIVRDGFLAHHLESCRALYGANAKAMTAALARHLHGLAEWAEPSGGMFLWLTLQRGLDATALLERALAANVAYVPGAPFYADSPDHRTLRLCYSTAQRDSIETGIAALGRVLKESTDAIHHSSTPGRLA